MHKEERRGEGRRSFCSRRKVAKLAATLDSVYIQSCFNLFLCEGCPMASRIAVPSPSTGCPSTPSAATAPTADSVSADASSVTPAALPFPSSSDLVREGPWIIGCDVPSIPGRSDSATSSSSANIRDAAELVCLRVSADRVSAEHQALA